VDQIVQIRRYPFCGHVYDLITDVGYFSASALIISNCRCTVVALAESELAEFGLEVQTQDASEEPDPGFSRNVGELWVTRR
jgi:hypothetical protein